MHHCCAIKHLDVVWSWWRRLCYPFSNAFRPLFLVERRLPNSDNNGGYHWFSCMKNSSRSPSRCWIPMYRQLKKKQVTCHLAVSFWDALDTRFGCCRLNSGNEFLGIVSWIAVDLFSMTNDTYFLYRLAPISSTVCIVRITDSSTQLPVSIAINSGQSS